MEIIKIGTTELTKEEAFALYESGKYIVNYGGIYQLHYSAAQKRVYGSKIYNEKGITRRGRYFAMDGKTINHLLGFEFVRTEATENDY